ncbi:hypothetical protein HA459_00565 [Rhizobium leguminosarum bv. trifolii]|uniref:hypothetical protein n=1 Tax=Rhizobium leguminosarum TaxID=384 RepID=UPI00140F715A|nr:hypothetical protein [Rhizobium leguminosarum]QIO70598.1 hypothetical protein HA459_00565 [Rhizobium leguminosarum bv. trifolii]QIO77603.1 hypothetical protein HA460_00560 [Rhizobium leguminosarum bv. trifolii]
MATAGLTGFPPHAKPTPKGGLDNVHFTFFSFAMHKETFLRLQYLRMINSDEFVVEQWRSSMSRFISDLWERTPTSPGRRFLQPLDLSLGFSPDNVEWQFPKVKRKGGSRAPVQADPKRVVKKAPVRPTKAEIKATKDAAKDRRRKAIAEEYLNWEQKRAARR